MLGSHDRLWTASKKNNHRGQYKFYVTNLFLDFQILVLVQNCHKLFG